WRLIGFAQYVSVFRQQLFWSILLKTIIWTLVNIAFHVTIGVFLAVLLHQKFIRGKSAWRVALILPWALPQYITALTWRGMFNYEYGAVNLLITKYLHLPPVQWLTSPLEAFLAVIITNIWLGGRALGRDLCDPDHLLTSFSEENACGRINLLIWKWLASASWSAGRRSDSTAFLVPEMRLAAP